MEQDDDKQVDAENLPYKALVLDSSKDGEVLTFTIQTKTKETSSSENGVVVLRQYEDFAFLSHCLFAHNDISSTVVPVLPAKPVITPSGAESKTKQQLGKESKTMIGDDFTKECKALQKYLDLVISEKMLNGDETLKAFLTEDKPPVRANAKKGILTSLKGALDDKRFHYHKDIDEEMQNIRNFTDQCAFLTKSCNECFKKLNSSEQRCSFHMANVTAAIRTLSATDTSENDLTTHLVKFAGILDEAKRASEKYSTIYEETVGFNFELYSKYLESAKEMLFRRTCKLIEFENASKALDKAKPKNQEQLQEAKDEAERQYEELTEISRCEIKKYHKNRVDEFQKALVTLAEDQIQNASKCSQLLSQAINQLKDM
eukprot:gene5945-6635_t